MDGKPYEFHISSNKGASSSIYDFGQAKDIWPFLEYTRSITLNCITLDTLLRSHTGPWDALIMDTQGSELLVLKGAEKLLKSIKYVKSEAADFEAYVGCAKVDDLNDFLVARGFIMTHKDPIATHPQGGHYYELLFERMTA